MKGEAMRIAMLTKVGVTIPGGGKIMEDTFYHLGFPTRESKKTFLMKTATRIGNGQHFDYPLLSQWLGKFLHLCPPPSIGISAYSPLGKTT
jgi:hypothetical protein